jgi:hypothetical protein
MNHQRAAEIQAVLEGVRLPATRDDLVRYAASEDADAAAVLSRLPDRSYERINEVGEELLRVQPRPPAPVPVPRPESGAPPGGDDYVNPSPRSGAVRDAPGGYSVADRLKEQSEQVAKQAKQQADSPAVPSAG